MKFGVNEVYKYVQVWANGSGSAALQLLDRYTEKADKLIEH